MSGYRTLPPPPTPRSPSPSPQPPDPDAATRAARAKANTERKSKYAQIAHLYQPQTQTRSQATPSPSQKLTAGSRSGVKRCSGSPSLGPPCSSPPTPKDKGSRRATGRHLSPREQLLEMSHCQKTSSPPLHSDNPPSTTTPHPTHRLILFIFLLPPHFLSFHPRPLRGASLRGSP